MERQPALDLLRVIAIIGVIAIHVFGAIVGNPDVRGSATWWAAVAIDLGFVWVVPMFVLVSGALLLTSRAQDSGPGHFYRKRLLRLGPAFVFWQVFYLWVVRAGMSGQELPLGTVVQLLADGTPYTHLYFLWLIVGLYAVAPVIWPFLRDGDRRRGLALAGVLLLVTALAYTTAAVLTWGGVTRTLQLSAFTQWLPYVGYFVAGFALSGIVLRRSRALIALAVAAIVLAGIVWEYGAAEPGTALRAILPVGYTSLPTMIATVCLFLAVVGLAAAWRPKPAVRRALVTLSDASFGVFLVHFVVLVGLRLLIPAFVPADRSLPIALLLWILVVVISFAIAIAARRVPFVRRVF
ncbi:acyltransferase [Microbacterium hominis]|uniref:Acyltransferase n=1 Tax=Microbacterium hominis TaxID=162426 RepID=A0A7D4Q8N7_9MICO|nr:acyltransferase [Microbacterium hominis]QKJ20019.1 acyltransferase [Microbacterium hominis]